MVFRSRTKKTMGRRDAHAKKRNRKKATAPPAASHAANQSGSTATTATTATKGVRAAVFPGPLPAYWTHMVLSYRRLLLGMPCLLVSWTCCVLCLVLCFVCSVLCVCVCVCVVTCCVCCVVTCCVLAHFEPPKGYQIPTPP